VDARREPAPPRRRNPWLALESGTDPVARARELRRAHASCVGAGGAPPPVVRDLIADSWRRSAGAGVRAEGHVPPRVHADDDLRTLREEHPLARMMPTLRHLLLDVAEAARHLLAVCAADGELLWVEGPVRVRVAAEDTMNFAEGTLWSERGAGTNALGTALAVGHPIQVFSAEHYNTTVHPWTCSAAPIFDPETGRLIGTIDLTGPFRMTHPHSLALVTAAAGAATGTLRHELTQADERLRDRYIRRLVHLGRRPTGVVSASGRVVMAQPVGWLGTHVTLPPPGGTGVLADGRAFGAEPIGTDDGWLVWAASDAAPARRLRLRLLGEPAAWLDGEPLHLSPRHAEILALLAAHPEGLDAERLGAALAGPGYSRTSVRSEVSRLRRLLGPCLSTRPYRLACEVDADLTDLRARLAEGRVDDALALSGSGPLLPRSRAPGVAELRAALEVDLRDAVDRTLRDADCNPFATFDAHGRPP
jgi:GAF domain